MTDRQGIYGIEHIPTGSIYIGSTKSFRQRKYDHWSRLNLGRHHSRELQLQWNADGAEAFRFVVIDHVQLVDDLLSTERKWIKQYMERGITVYNYIGGNGNASDVIERRAAGHRGLHPHPDLVRRRAESRALDWRGFVSPDGVVFQDIHNLAAFCREHGLLTTHMLKVHMGKRHQHRGWTALQEGTDAKN